ncbi:hypothetical protein DFH09DRAFT_1402623 [Mycena vulgaris]|nr:hypothetical protein DFH09DRAFT_1402623 [Mycena vulgaris]
MYVLGGLILPVTILETLGYVVSIKVSKMEDKIRGAQVHGRVLISVESTDEPHHQPPRLKSEEISPIAESPVEWLWSDTCVPACGQTREAPGKGRKSRAGKDLTGVPATILPVHIASLNPDRITQLSVGRRSRGVSSEVAEIAGAARMKLSEWEVSIRSQTASGGRGGRIAPGAQGEGEEGKAKTVDGRARFLRLGGSSWVFSGPGGRAAAAAGTCMAEVKTKQIRIRNSLKRGGSPWRDDAHCGGGARSVSLPSRSLHSNLTEAKGVEEREALFLHALVSGMKRMETHDAPQSS